MFPDKVDESRMYAVEGIENDIVDRWLKTQVFKDKILELNPVGDYETERRVARSFLRHFINKKEIITRKKSYAVPDFDNPEKTKDGYTLPTRWLGTGIKTVEHECEFISGTELIEIERELFGFDYDLSYENYLLKRKVDWEYWSVIPACELDEAVYLSLGISPLLGDEELTRKDKKKVDSRLNYAIKNLEKNTGKLKCIKEDSNQPECSTVSIFIFCEWVSSMGWDLPEELSTQSNNKKKEKAQTYSKDKLLQVIAMQSEMLLDGIKCHGYGDIATKMAEIYELVRLKESTIAKNIFGDANKIKPQKKPNQKK